MPNLPITDSKILIILNKGGGEDTQHRYIPRDHTLLNQINVHRPASGIGFSPAEVDSYTGGHMDANWCLHPSLNPLRNPLWEAGDMALTHLVGPMFTDLGPLHIDLVREATINGNTTGIILPFGLGAHDWQIDIMHSLVSRPFSLNGTDWEIRTSGFLGRLASLFTPHLRDQGSGQQTPPTLPMNIAVGSVGSLPMLTNGQMRPLGVPAPNYGKFSTTPIVSPQTTAVIARLNAIMGVSPEETRQNVFRKVHNSAVKAASFFQPIVESPYSGSGAVFAVDQYFSNNIYGYEGILRGCARMIERRAFGTQGLPNRMILGGTHGSYDTHPTQGKLTGTLPSFFATEAAAVVSFKNAIMALDGTGNLWRSITISDTSEFSRTLLANGAGGGTDHAWARTFTVWGGSVRGKGRDGSTGHFGMWPTAYGINTGPGTGGSDDVNGSILGGGSLRPRISHEQYWDPILRWFGCNNADIAAILLRRHLFAGASPNLLMP